MPEAPPPIDVSHSLRGQHATERRASWWDKAGISLSAACMVHCTTLPVVVAFSPSLFGSLLSDASFHQWLLLFILPTAIAAFGISWRRHKRWPNIIPGLVGVVFLLVAAGLGHDTAGELGEKLLTFAGGVALILGHTLNLKQRSG